jgi:hypothetical protein
MSSTASSGVYANMHMGSCFLSYFWWVYIPVCELKTNSSPSTFRHYHILDQSVKTEVVDFLCAHLETTSKVDIIIVILHLK